MDSCGYNSCSDNVAYVFFAIHLIADFADKKQLQQLLSTVS